MRKRLAIYKSLERVVHALLQCCTVTWHVQVVVCLLWMELVVTSVLGVQGSQFVWMRSVSVVW